MKIAIIAVILVVTVFGAVLVGQGSEQGAGQVPLQATLTPALDKCQYLQGLLAQAQTNYAAIRIQWELSEQGC